MGDIADRIRLAREKKGLSVRLAAKTSGVSPAAWSAWEAGESVPRGSNRMKVALALNISSEWLRTGEAEPPPRTSPPLPQDSYTALLVALGPFLRAVDGYLALLHQQLPLDQRIGMAAALIARCHEIGLKDPETLSLEDLHAVLSKEAFG